MTFIAETRCAYEIRYLPLYYNHLVDTSIGELLVHERIIRPVVSVSVQTRFIFNILEFLIDSIFVMFGGRVFQQTFGKPIGTHCVPLLTDLFLYSYEADFIHGLLIEKNRNETSPSL